MIRRLQLKRYTLLDVLGVGVGVFDGPIGIVVVMNLRFLLVGVRDLAFLVFGALSVLEIVLASPRLPTRGMLVV